MSRTSSALPNLDIDLARTFVAICETGNFSRAAERVFRTPSAVSLQVKKLEETVGRALFRRETRLVELTGDGEHLLGYARKLLRLNDEAMEFFRMPAMEGKVCFGAPYDAGIYAIPSILRRFATTHPHVEVDVRLDSSAELRRRCAAGEIDVALLATDDHPGFLAVEVYREALVWIGLKNGAAVERDPLPLAVADQGCAWRGAALAGLDAAGIRYRVAYSSENCQAQIAAVEADLAIAALPLSVASNRLVRLDGEGSALPSLGTYRVYMMKREAGGAVADALAAHVGEEFRELEGRGARIFA
ncbi:LysR substrate-binding domain-containing protein [Aurantimonas sp. VKM B-3413]|uniref:LysR substrate-binding domain-containing protein n=1 Tax=Aurantimonas sp. VKM B-3413 TaxID=2779401 RepID=UPI001E51D86A|nr:LysR substrate-binding domain-containing protein [Aurantimonas sp. VKM B-3413]MCB8836645.1 LysR family transcriptional regulator [Aurantimonas sp. VKM B-3413]